MGREAIVAIIGRPNVGKSTLVNRIVGSRRAIVDDMPGVTRDRAYYNAQWLGRHFTLVDTGGLDPSEESIFASQINEQVYVALAEADVVLFVVDGPAGITPMDETIAQSARQLGKPIFLVVNKIDNQAQMGYTAEFYALSLGDPHPVSAMHGTVGVGDLLDKVFETLDSMPNSPFTFAEPESESLKIAFLGRPNVGKSSIVNRLIGEERSIVSDISGTTRDAIDTDIEIKGKTYTLVDTAGIRRKSKVGYGVELFSVDRAIRTMRRADVMVLVIDAVEGITDQDKRLIESSNEAGRPLILVMNKWDLIPNKGSNATRDAEKKLFKEVPQATYAPVIFTSALTGQRLDRIFDVAQEVHANNHRRIQTSVVNQVVSEAFTLHPPPRVKNKQLRIYYATQVSVSPPTFLLFVNNDTLMKDSYKRYLENRLRENIEFRGTPIVLACRNKKEREAKK